MRNPSGLGAIARSALSGLALVGAAAVAMAFVSHPFDSFREVLQRPESPPEPNAAGDIVVRHYAPVKDCPPGSPEGDNDRSWVRIRLRHLRGGEMYALLVDNPANGFGSPELFLRGTTGRGGTFHCYMDTGRCQRGTLGSHLPFDQSLSALAGRGFEVRTVDGVEENDDLILGEVVLEGNFPGSQED